MTGQRYNLTGKQGWTIEHKRWINEQRGREGAGSGLREGVRRDKGGRGKGQEVAGNGEKGCEERGKGVRPAGFARIHKTKNDTITQAENGRLTYGNIMGPMC